MAEVFQQVNYDEDSLSNIKQIENFSLKWEKI